MIDPAPLRTVVDSEPSARFPVYTRGNAGEVFPHVMTPLTGSLIGDASHDGQARAMLGLGLFRPSDIDDTSAFGTGVFGGYLYGNLSLIRVACVRAPGLSASDADRQVAGLSDDAPPHRADRRDRNLVATVRSTSVIGRHIMRPSIADVDSARRATDRWRASLADPATMSDAELISLARRYPPRFADRMALLLTYSGLAGAASATLERFAARTGADAATGLALTAGLGTIDSAAPAFRLWALGRLVAASPALTDLFDSAGGVVDLRRRAGEPDIDSFAAGLDEFVAAHGARGPDEWELASPTWGTDPDIAIAAVDRLRRAPDERDPVVAARRLAAERERATQAVRSQLPRPVRPLFDRVALAARLYAAGRERAKALFIDDTYPIRRALFELAARARGRGGPEERRDFFLVTADELADFVAAPGAFTAVLDERRRIRDYFEEREPPFVFDGAPPDPCTWAQRSAPRPGRDGGSPSHGRLQGQGVCAGVARGTARVVRDPADPRALEPGDILIAPITDPAWTPLFLAVAGVVVEVGAQQSHAAIVARELGIPAIVGVAGATTRLADGQLVEIDGAAGTVRIL